MILNLRIERQMMLKDIIFSSLGHFVNWYENEFWATLVISLEGLNRIALVLSVKTGLGIKTLFRYLKNFSNYIISKLNSAKYPPKYKHMK